MMKVGRFVVFVLFVFWGMQVFSQVNVLHIEQLTYRDGLPSNSVQTIKQDKFGYIWFSSFSGLSRYDGYSFYEYMPNPEDPSTIFTKSVYNMVLDSTENLWIAFFDTAHYCMYNYQTDDFTRVSSQEVPKYIKDLSNRRNIRPNVAMQGKEQWEFKRGMLFRSSPESADETQYYLSYLQKEQIDETRVRAMIIDSFGTLWIGTEDRGVFKVNIYTKPFYTFYYNDKGTPRIFNNIVRAIHQDKNNNLYIGTQYDGVYVLNRSTDQLTSLGGPAEPDYNRFKDGQVRCFFEDSRGHIWVGTKGGLGEYFPETGRIRNYNRFGEVSIPHNWAYAVAEDQQGNIWVGTFGGGIARYDRESDRFVHIDPLTTLANSKVYCMITDRNNNLWVGTHGGGITCLSRTDSVDRFEPVHYLYEAGNSNTISSNRIFSLYEDFDGNIWAATDYGLNCINTKTGDIKRYFHRDGMSDDIVFAVSQDQQGNIWMSNQKGISKLETETGQFSHYNEKDGLQSNEMAENAVFRNALTGELIFGSVSGMVSFFPNQITENNILPKVVLTRLEVLNQEVRPGDKINNRVVIDQHISLANQMTLHYSHRSFSIEFAALHFSNPLANEYEYTLVNYDDKWISTTAKRRFATYSNLPAGKYIFKVRASNDDGVWSPEEKSLIIKVKPPWWFSVWAFIVYVMIISAISYFSILYLMARMSMKNQVRYEVMKARKMEELNQMKEQFFTKISHELRTPLSLLIDPLRKLNAKSIETNDLDYYYSVMYQNAQRLSKLVNELLDFKKIESKEFVIRPKRGQMVSFIQNIVNTFRISSADKAIQLSFRSNYPEIIADFDPDVLEKIIFNLVSNAIKYNRKGGTVQVEVLALDQQQNGLFPVKINVSDTGIGISEQAATHIFDLYYQEDVNDGVHRQGSGIGLSLSRELVLLHGGTISFTSEQGKGSCFSAELPVGIKLTGIESEAIQPIETAALNGLDDDEIVENEEFNEQRDKNQQLILVVEDNDDVRKYIRKDLEPAFDVIEACNGVEGWEKVCAYLPDLVVTDIMMPEMDGYELCRKIKTEKDTCHIPVIALTALTSEKAALEAIENGADAFVSKPFSSVLLRARIRNLVESRKVLLESANKLPFIDVKKMANNLLDETFLNQAVESIEEFISEPEFNIDLLSDKLGMSRRHLSHKIKTLTGQTVNEFVKTVRLNKGAEMMLNTDQNISEIAYQLGYTAPANFSRSFSKQFGKTPTEYIASIMDNNN